MSALSIISNVLSHSTLFQIFKVIFGCQELQSVFGTPVSYLPNSASWTKEWRETYKVLITIWILGNP